MKSGLDREHLVNAYGNVARGSSCRRGRSRACPKVRGAVTDAQIEAAKARVARWKLVNAAVGGVDYQDAACGTDNMLNNDRAPRENSSSAVWGLTPTVRWPRR